jgi:predicted small integral membrane protein
MKGWLAAAWEAAALGAAIAVVAAALRRVDRGGRPEDMAGRTMLLLLATLIGVGLAGSLLIALAGLGQR